MQKYVLKMDDICLNITSGSSEDKAAKVSFRLRLRIVDIVYICFAQ